MTLKTVTGPSIAAALADARRLFGDDVVLLQSSPSVHGQPAAVTVAFDAPPARAASPAPPPPAAPAAVPEPFAPAPARAYGYAAVRNTRPAFPEPISVSPPPAPAPRPLSAPPPAPPPAPSVTPDEIAELRARLAQLEAMVASGAAAAPAPEPRRAPLVFVGPGGSGKTSLALRLAQAPHLVDAANVAVVIVAPEAERFVDPAPVFWGVGVPVAVVATADEMREAVETFADADLLLIDTPSLPLHPKRSRPFVQRLGEVLAPLVDVEVHFVIDATRTPDSLTSETVTALGIRPDALALTRLDEAGPGAWRWGGHLDCPIQLISASPDLSGLHTEPASPAAAQPAGPTAAARPASSAAQPYSDDEIEAYFQSPDVRAAARRDPAPGRPSGPVTLDRAALMAEASRPASVLA